MNVAEFVRVIPHAQPEMPVDRAADHIFRGRDARRAAQAAGERVFLVYAPPQLPQTDQNRTAGQRHGPVGASAPEKLKRGVTDRAQRKDCGSLQFHFHHRIYFARNGWIYARGE